MGQQESISVLIPHDHKEKLLEAGKIYLRMGWKLCAITGLASDGVSLSKGPKLGGWNTEDGAISTVEQLEKVLSSGRIHGLGLLHAFSGTCCLDIDDLSHTREYLLENFKLDILQYIESGVVWHNGGTNKLKLLYKSDPRPLVAVKIPKVDDDGNPDLDDQGDQKQLNILEFRCAAKEEGKSVQDVLPPSLHPTGRYYQWQDPEYFSTIPQLPQALATIWEKLGGRVRKTDYVQSDPIARILMERDLVIDTGVGKLFILCPFREGHSTQDSVSSCTYLLPHFDGHTQGNFRCLHASCEDRTNEQFLEKLGLLQGDEELRLEVALKRKKQVNLFTATEILTLHGRYKGVFQFNELSREIERKPSELDKIIPAHPKGTLRNEDITALSLDLTKVTNLTREWPRELLRHAVEMVSKQHSYNPARANLQHYKSKWDGVNRLESWFIDEFGASVDQGQNIFEDPQDAREYLTIIGRLFFIGLVARAFSPGVKHDCMLILEGAQGIGKSTFAEKLAEAIYPESYVNLIDISSYKEFGMHIKGKVVAEISELHAMRKADANHLKAVLSMRSDRYREPYAIETNDAPRSCVFIGTTNEICGKYLVDTENRRFWRMVVNKKIDLDKFTVELPHLLGEATARFLDGEAWHPKEKRELELLAKGVAIAMCGDPWEDVLATEIPRRMGRGEFPGNRSWVQREDRLNALSLTGRWPEKLLIYEVCDILGIPRERRRKGLYTDLSRIMARLGYTMKPVRISAEYRGNGFELSSAKDLMEARANAKYSVPVDDIF